MNPPAIVLLHGTLTTVVQTRLDDTAYVLDSNWQSMFAPKTSCLESSFRKFTIPAELVEEFLEIFFEQAGSGDLEGCIEVIELHDEDDEGESQSSFEIDWTARGPLREADIETSE